MVTSRARMLLSATIVATVTLLAGCGDDDKKAARDDAPTRAEFIKQVDAVCAKTTRASKPTNRKLQALVDGSGTFSSRLKKAAPLLRTTYRLQKAKVDRIDAMTPPPKDRAQIAEVIKTSYAALAELRSGIPVAERGDLKNFIDVAFDANGTRAEAERLGTTYGFRSECFAVPIDLSSF